MDGWMSKCTAIKPRAIRVHSHEREFWQMKREERIIDNDTIKQVQSLGL